MQEHASGAGPLEFSSLSSLALYLSAADSAMEAHTAARPWRALDAARKLPRPYFFVVLLALMQADLSHAFSLPFSLGASRFLASNAGHAFNGRARTATLPQLSMSGGRGGGRGGRGGGRGRGGSGPSTTTGRFPAPKAPKAEDRAGMSRKDWDLASTIGGPKKSAQQLAQLLGLAKVFPCSHALDVSLSWTGWTAARFPTFFLEPLQRLFSWRDPQRTSVPLPRENQIFFSQGRHFR